ncbi:MAG TPA: pitrilysin family protein, partial [Kiloniellaceae bacterium]|nr:pitrilysin family protein [Kiloniellaceae bacterium]
QALGRPVLGRESIVSALGGDDLRSFLQKEYGPRRMVVAAAGRIETASLTALCEAAFGDLTPDSGGALEPARYQGGEYRETRDLEQVHLLFGFPSCSLLDERYYAVNTLSTLLGGGMSSRLFQEVREKRGLAYSVYTFNAAFLDGGLFGIYAGTGPNQVQELVPVLCDTLNQLAGDIAAEELERAKAQMRASLRMSRESTSSRCEQLAQQILTYGAPLDPDDILNRIEAVELSDLERILAETRASAPSLAAIGPLKRLESFDRIVARLGSGP